MTRVNKPVQAVIAKTVPTVDVAHAGAEQADASITQFTVSDTFAQVFSNIGSLGGFSKLTGINVTDANAGSTAYSIYLAQQAGLDKLLNFSIEALNVTVAQAATVQANSHIARFQASDSASNLLTALPALSAYGKLDQLSVNAGTSLSADAVNFFKYQTTLDKIAPWQQLLVNGVTVAKAAAAQADSHVSAFTVTDTAAKILLGLAALNADSHLTSLALVSGTALTVDATNYLKYRTLLDKIVSGQSLVVTGLTAAQSATAQADSHVSGYTVTDTNGAMLDLGPVAPSKLTSIHLTDVSITGGTHYETIYGSGLYAAYRTLIDKLDHPAMVQAKVAQAASAQADSHVWSFSVIDTAQNIAAGLAGFVQDSHLDTIIATDVPGLTISAANYIAFRPILDSKLALDNSLVVNGLTAAQALTAQADVHVSSFTVQDSAAHVLASLNTLNGDTKLTGVTLGSGETLGLTYAQFQADTFLVNKLAAGVATVSGVAADKANTVAGNSHVGHEAVKDTLAHIGANLDTLETLAKTGKLTGIVVSDVGHSITVTPAQYAADADAIKLMSGSFTINHGGASGFHINLMYDAAAQAAPQAFRDSMAAAAHYFEKLIATPETFNLKVGYGEWDGAPLNAGVLGEATPFFTFDSTVNVTWAQYKAVLAAHATSADQLTAVRNMTSDPTHGGTIYISRPEAKAFGLLAPNDSGTDGEAAFAADNNGSLFTYGTSGGATSGHYDFYGVALHEISHALGRLDFPFNSGNSGLDMFRYTAPGHQTVNPNDRAYFSIDGGTTNLNWYATSSDLGDWDSTAGNDANVAYSPPGAANIFTHADVVQMNVLGYALA